MDVPLKRFPSPIWIVVICLVCGGVAWFYHAVKVARRAMIASNDQSRLNQLSLAFHNYHEDHGCLPPAYVADAAGKPMHSWRALILPYIDAVELHKLYDFSEPWDGPHNRKLAHRMPAMFHCDSEVPSDTFTNYVVIVGSDTPFPGSKTTKFADFEDGRSSTILAAEISLENSRIPWMEPRDLNVETMSFQPNDKSRPAISTRRWNGPYMIFAETLKTYSPSDALLPEVFRALTTLRGHEPVFMLNVSERDFGGGSVRRLVSPHVGPATDADLARITNWESVGELWVQRSQVTDDEIFRLKRDYQHLLINK